MELFFAYKKCWFVPLSELRRFKATNTTVKRVESDQESDEMVALRPEVAGDFSGNKKKTLEPETIWK